MGFPGKYHCSNKNLTHGPSLAFVTDDCYILYTLRESITFISVSLNKHDGKEMTAVLGKIFLFFCTFNIR